MQVTLLPWNYCAINTVIFWTYCYLLLLLSKGAENLGGVSINIVYPVHARQAVWIDLCHLFTRFSCVGLGKTKWTESMLSWQQLQHIYNDSLPRLWRIYGTGVTSDAVNPSVIQWSYKKERKKERKPGLTSVCIELMWVWSRVCPFLREHNGSTHYARKETDTQYAHKETDTHMIKPTLIQYRHWWGRPIMLTKKRTHTWSNPH